MREDCPYCGDREGGCEICEDGKIVLRTCPHLAVRRETWRCIEAAELLGRGLPPEAGGMLDQNAAFLAAARIIRQQQRIWRARQEPFGAAMRSEV